MARLQILQGFSAVTFARITSHVSFNLSRLHTGFKKMAEIANGILDPTQEALLNEVCILVDESDKNIGSASKKDCHLWNNGQCLLHRAFSVFLFNTNGQLLLQQRSDAKITFPTMFTNTCCSHPLAISSELDEKDVIGVRRAAQRKLEQELGIKAEYLNLEDLQYITRIHYKAKSNGAWGEHEIDYILIAQKDLDLDPNPNEVKSVRYVSREELRDMIDNHDRGTSELTPWFRHICGSHLFEWWDNLSDLTKFIDTRTIHRY